MNLEPTLQRKLIQAVAELSRDDMLALAAYFAAKPWPNLNQPRATAAEQSHIGR